MSNNVVTYIYKRYCHIADTDLQIFHHVLQAAYAIIHKKLFIVTSFCYYIYIDFAIICKPNSRLMS